MIRGNMAQIETFFLPSLDGILLEAAVHLTEQSPVLGTVVLVHGLTVTLDEGGLFVRLADRLAESGFNALRFSFRGHGRSGGTQRGVTIAGEMLDLEAVMAYARARFTTPLAIVAASFGAVSTCLLLTALSPDVRCVALWNPALDLQRTLVASEAAWGQRNFSPERVRQLETDGFLRLEQGFEIGRVLGEEIRRYQPVDAFLNSTLPAMIVHGDQDTYVPYAISQQVCKQRDQCELFTIAQCEHGFGDPVQSDQVLDITVKWLLQQMG
jgi:uncharacterized protein